MRRRAFLVGFFSLILGLVPLSFGLVAGASTALADGITCQTAGTSGLTAVKVATSGEHISGTINADSKCDLGIYVGPGVTNVVIQGATVEGAKDHGILVQDTSNIQILDNTVEHNVVDQQMIPNPNGNNPPTVPAIAENKAIALVGTSHSTVSGNEVFDTVGSGGISINDDGPTPPGTLNPGLLRASEYNVVSDNNVHDNNADCGIVLSAYNPGAGVNHNTVEGNTVSRNVAGIVVAADPPGTMANNNIVIRNTATDNFIPGIIVHSNAPGDEVSGTAVMFNVVSGNGPDGEIGLTKNTGIVLAGTSFGPSGPPTTYVTNTIVMFNLITNEHYGVAKIHTKHSPVYEFGLNHATVPVYTVR